MTSNHQFKYHWFSIGDIGASATIIFDNLTVLTFISLILNLAYGFPTDILLTHIIPGTVVGVLVGNLLCLWSSFKLSKRDKRHVTAMPFGLDAPSAIGFAVLIIGPAFLSLKSSMPDTHAAGVEAWHIGVGCLFITGLIKLAFSFFANRIKQFIPQAALLGAIGGVAIALIGFLPLVSIFRQPIVGLASLAVVFITMLARISLPLKIPGIPAAILIGTVLYYILIPFGLSGSMPNLSVGVSFLLPAPNIGFFSLMHEIVSFIPIVIPFSLLVVFGSMSVTESARCMGEEYKVRDLLLIDSVSTIIAALFGGVSQTTPYAGFPAYKQMDARAGFLLINVIVVGIGGILGIVGFIVNLVPESVIAPVLLYVAFEIALQGFIQCEKKYYAAILFGFFPSIAQLLKIKFTDSSIISADKFQADIFTQIGLTLSDNLVIVILGNGFIVTGTLWAALLCFAVERKWWSSFICTIILAILSYLGAIHSLYTSGEMYYGHLLPKNLSKVPLELSLGYLLFGIIILLLSRCPENKLVEPH